MTHTVQYSVKACVGYMPRIREREREIVGEREKESFRERES
jgi:hypothetical protein